MYCYCIEKSEIKKKKGQLIKIAPTLKIFGVVSRFLYSGGWQVWCCNKKSLQDGRIQCPVDRNLEFFLTSHIDFCIIFGQCGDNCK